MKVYMTAEIILKKKEINRIRIETQQAILSKQQFEVL